MAAILPVLQVVGTVFGVISAINQGRAQRDAANYNATIAMQNAGIARQDAAANAEQKRRETVLRLGAIRAAQGKSGGDAGTGSVLDVLGDTAAQSELERQDILYRGELAARGYTNTATLDMFQGKNAMRTAYGRAGSELLKGGVSMYDNLTRVGGSGGGSGGNVYDAPTYDYGTF